MQRGHSVVTSKVIVIWELQSESKYSIFTFRSLNHRNKWQQDGYEILFEVSPCYSISFSENNVIWA
jgi:hypothetical protein